MANRKRQNQILFWVSDEEKKIIQEKMALLGTKNMGAYLRKMAIDGYIINVDYSETKKLIAAVNKIGANINSICRRMNATSHFYKQDIDELKEKLDQVWRSLKSKLSEEL